MKCEICHQNNAEMAIEAKNGQLGEELYVCRDCARKERLNRQKKSQRTRKMANLPPGMSISVSGMCEGDAPPPIIEAIMNAVNGIVADMSSKPQTVAQPNPERELSSFALEKIPAPYRVGKFLHLEGLHLIGELEPVHRAMRALGMQLAGIEADGVRETGHVYEVKFEGSADRARRVVEDLVTQERNARVRLFEEMPRVLGDSLCRALAILKNARLLSPGELFDLLSPLRIAAIEKMIEGATLKEINLMMSAVDLSSREENVSVEERDRIDAARADEMNKRFEDVVLNERAEEKFL